MTQLQLGECKISELAEWFRIGKTYLSTKKKEKLEELKEFCKYEIISSTKINILEIYFPVYEKKASMNYSIVKQEVPKKWNIGGLDCCSRVSHSIYEDRENNKLTLSETSTYEYVRQVKNVLYGKCGSQNGGELGISRYVWGKKNDDGTYSYLTEEENKIKEELLKKYFKNSKEASLFVQDSINKGEISKEEAWEMYSELTNVEFGFHGFMTEFRERTGIQLVKCTEVELVQKFN